MHRVAVARLACAIVFALAVSDLHGQIVLPPGVQPGQVERQFQRPPEPTAKPEPIVIPGAQLTPPRNAATIAFVLADVTVAGVTVFPATAIRHDYEQDLQKQVTLAEVYRIAERLTARYRNAGYILSQVIVPAQTIDAGAIRLQAIEGYVANVQVEGGTAALRGRLRKYAERIRNTRPLTMAALERNVLLMNDLPGVVAHVVLAPSTVPNASDLIVQATKRSLLADISSDNRGSSAQGPTRASGDLDIHSLAGVASRTEIKGVSTFTPELTYVALAHDQFVGTQGGKVTISGSYVYSRPQEFTIVPLDLTTRSETTGVSYSYPVLRRRSRNLYVHGSFASFDSTSDVFGVNDTVDRVRSLSVGFTYDAADRLAGLNVMDIAFSQGLRALGASSDGAALLSRPTGRTDFRKVSVYAQRLQSLSSHWSIVAAADGQYAFTDLLSSEMFSIGGELFGRGYDPSALLNDHGAALKFDLRYTKSWSGRAGGSLMPYAFTDLGRVWQRTLAPGIDRSQSAASAGGGLRVSAARVSVFVEAAKPMTHVEGQDPSRDVRVYAGVSVR